MAGGMIVAPTGERVATLTVDNHEHGYAEVLAWIAEDTPAPGSSSGWREPPATVGLARAVQAAGLVVVEVERPKRSDRRRGKSDPIDAHLAALHTLRLDARRQAALGPVDPRRVRSWRAWTQRRGD